MLPPKEALDLYKWSIGMKLQLFRHMKHYPDNFTPSYIAQVKEDFSLELRHKAQLYRLHPELRPKTRTRQMRLPI